MNMNLATAISSKSVFVATPLKYEKQEKNETGDSHEDELGVGKSFVTLKRDHNQDDKMLDNLVDLIVSTRRGSFLSDPDFGFEFWNHEYNSLYYKDINASNTNSQQVECIKSIKNSLQVYAPQLKSIDVKVSLDISKHYISITVQGRRNNGISENAPYKRVVQFFIDPTAKQI